MALLEVRVAPEDTTAQKWSYLRCGWHLRCHSPKVALLEVRVALEDAIASVHAAPALFGEGCESAVDQKLQQYVK